MADNNQNWGHLFEGWPSRSYNGNSLTIGEQLERSIKFSCAKVLKGKSRIEWDKAHDEAIEAHNPFYPEVPELAQIVRVKLLAARERLEAIWNNPDEEQGGIRGVSKFVLAVADNAAVDYFRYQQRHNGPEILAARLDEPVASPGEDRDWRDTSSASETTLADLISDSDGIQPFQLDDLRGDLTDEEFQVLRKKIHGATQKEIAEDTGETVGQVSNAYRNAKSKAREWVKGLKTAPYHRTRAHLCARFTRNRCTRPDRLSGAELEAWNPANSRNVVEFHDESSAWHPPITNNPRVRANRECYNDACTHGGAVGPDNLTLPSSQSTNDLLCDFTADEKQSCDFRTMHGVTWLQPRMEAVRFLPAITGKIKRFCADCEKAKERAEKQVTPSARNSGRIFMIHEPKEQSTLTRSEVIRFVRDNELVKQDLAAIANVPAARLSDYLHDKPVSEEYAERIEDAVANIVYVWTTFAPIKIALDDPQAFWKAVELADKTHAAESAWEGFQAGHHMRQEHNDATAAD